MRAPPRVSDEVAMSVPAIDEPSIVVDAKTALDVATNEPDVVESTPQLKSVGRHPGLRVAPGE